MDILGNIVPWYKTMHSTMHSCKEKSKLGELDLRMSSFFEVALHLVEPTINSELLNLLRAQMFSLRGL